MTNYERIRAMSLEELAAFLELVKYGRDSDAPWADEFDMECCRVCERVTVEVEGYRDPLILTECDFSDGVCPFGDSILWWLKREAKS